MLTNALKIAWKVLLRHPFYTFITLFGISLTLTVLMVLTSFIDHVIGSHYPELKRDRSLYIDRLMMTDSAQSSMSSGPMSFKFLANYAKTLKTADRVTVFSTPKSSNAYIGSRKIKVNTKFTDADFWTVTDFDFLEGKPYNEQSIVNGDFVAVITDGFKHDYFSEDDKSVVGKTIEIENVRYKVIGVVRGTPITRYFTNADIYFPYTVPKSNYQSGGMRGNYSAILLAKSSGDMMAVQREFQERMSRIPKPGVEDGFKYAVLEVKSDSFKEYALNTIMAGNPGARVIFYGVITFILLMLLGLPTINLVNLNVSRMLERASEIGIRKAFGAPIRTLMWQFIVENIFITFIGGAIALVFTFVIIMLINTSGWIAYSDLTINVSVFVVSLLICLLFGLLSGVIPAVRMSKMNIVEVLKS